LSIKKAPDFSEASLINDGYLNIYDSLYFNGCLLRSDSLKHIGYLVYYDSLPLPGYLKHPDSLLVIGCLSICDSLCANGYLKCNDSKNVPRNKKPSKENDQTSMGLMPRGNIVNNNFLHFVILNYKDTQYLI